MPTLAYNSFASGEISPRLGARFDQVKYQTGAHKMRNMVPTLEGAATNRAGTGYVMPLHDVEAADAPRLLPFVYDNEQSYVVVIDALNRIHFIRNGTPLFNDDLNVVGAGQVSGAPYVTVSFVSPYMVVGSLVWIDGTGVPEMNRRFFVTASAGSATIQLLDVDGSAIDATGWVTSTAGGSLRRVERVSHGWGGDLSALRYAQSADVMFLAKSGNPLKQIKRISEAGFSLADVVFGAEIATPATATAAGVAGSSSARYQITAIASSNLEESLPGPVVVLSPLQQIESPLANPIKITFVGHGLHTGDRIYLDGFVSYFTELNAQAFTVTWVSADVFTLDGTVGTGALTRINLGRATRIGVTAWNVNFPDAANPVTLSWAAVSGALEYNIYREINGIFGYVGTSATTSFKDLGYAVDPRDTPPLNRAVFSDSDTYPAAVGLFQQRLLLGGATASRERIDASRSGIYYNFSRSNPIQADDSFGWVMASNQVQGIQHIVEMSRCIVFTTGSVFTLEGDDAGSLVPTAVNPRKRAEHGVGDLGPITIGNAVLYVQAAGKIVREIMPGSGEDFNAKDLTVYSRHLFDNNAIVSWAYAENPGGIVWCARDDGKLLGLTYLREHDVWGWSQHDTGVDADDRVVDVCTVPENGESVTYFIVARTRQFTTGPATMYYVERMASRHAAHAADAKLLDSYRYYEAKNTDVAALYTLSYSSFDGWLLTRSGTTLPWTIGVSSPDIGRVILLRHGDSGTRLWCTVSRIVSGSIASVLVRCSMPGAINRDTGAPQDATALPTAADPDTVPFPVSLPFSTAIWSASVSRVTDLSHLEGRVVRAVGDGFPQGPFTVVNGTVELATPAVQVVVGLPVVSELTTSEADNVNGETWADRTKTIGSLTVRVESTGSVEIGTAPWALSPYDPQWRESERRYDDGHLYTGRLAAHGIATQSAAGRVYLRQSEGLPLTVLGIYPQTSLGDN